MFTIVQYGGGGDWYNGITGVKNLLHQMEKRCSVKIYPREKIVKLTDDDLFLYPFLFINGHGNIRLTDEEVVRLRQFLYNGGFLFCNDDYGLDTHLRREIKKVFPDKEFVTVPFDHPIYSCFYKFTNGLPKIHEHYPGPPKGLGIFINNRLVLFYAYNADIADGWEKQQVHHDSLQKRELAIQMGINIIYFALTQ
ncbi:MAG: DUF4159 domain-containing protein [Spirochaetes bacterium]|nr:DUF4159 domain-containing protein [Spirochaetota bacterium]